MMMKQLYKGLRSLQSVFIKLKDRSVLKPEEFNRWLKAEQRLHNAVACGNKRDIYSAVDNMARLVVEHLVRIETAEK